MPNISEVVKQLLILNGLFFVATQFLFPDISNALAVYYPTSTYFRPWQIVTHMFMHANFNHLLFNMFALYMFGSALEAYLGPKRFLTFYLLSGIGALCLYMLVLHFELSSLTGFQYQRFVNTPMLGASGAVFGLLAGYGMVFPNNRIMLLIPPIPMKAKYFVMIYAGIELAFGVSRINDGVAHFAHLGGAIVGALIILYWRKAGNR